MTQEKLIQTGSQTVGPFFHYGLIFGGENVLVNEKTRGERILIEGTVYDGDGAPVPDALVEIWQPDAQGFFNHPADPNQAEADKEFRGFGRADTVNGGKYSFKTVKPGALVDSDGQANAPYINVRVFSRGMLIHAVTRIYFADENSNATDPVLSRVDSARRATLIATREEFGDLPCYRFHIHLQGENETIFFDV
ncbi:MAG: protocatechuate 3,4-dioxygenase subunit alpha [Caldilineaceae bacterium]